jgi:hypothetical protein
LTPRFGVERRFARMQGISPLGLDFFGLTLDSADDLT